MNSIPLKTPPPAAVYAASSARAMLVSVLAASSLLVAPAVASENSSSPWLPFLESRFQSAHIHQYMARSTEGGLAGEHQRKSIEALREALAALEKEGTPEQRGYARHQLGLALLDRAESSPLPERDKLLAEAEQCFRVALESFPRESFAVPHAAALDNLAIALHARTEWPTNLDPARKAAWHAESEANARAALEIYESLGRTIDALRIRVNLLTVFPSGESKPGTPKPREALEQTIRGLEDILADPALGKRSVTRASAQRSLASQLVQLAEADPANAPAHLERARRLLIEIPGARSGDPRGWVRVQTLLGNVCMAQANLPDADKTALLEQARDHYTEALDASPPEADSLQRASIRLHWGLASVLLSDSPSIPENRRESLIREGLAATFESMSVTTTDPKLRAESLAMIEMLKNPSSAADSPPDARASSEPETKSQTQPEK